MGLNAVLQVHAASRADAIAQVEAWIEPLDAERGYKVADWWLARDPSGEVFERPLHDFEKAAGVGIASMNPDAGDLVTYFRDPASWIAEAWATNHDYFYVADASVFRPRTVDESVTTFLAAVKRKLGDVLERLAIPSTDPLMDRGAVGAVVPLARAFELVWRTAQGDDAAALPFIANVGVRYHWLAHRIGDATRDPFYFLLELDDH